MNVYYGVWSPLSGNLPETKDYDFAAYYITEDGVLEEQEYKKDTWLIYICESRGTLSERSYWRVSEGIVLFNPDAHTNVPSAGYYTKVRLDNSGNIVAASDIEYDDLPIKAKEKFNQISDEHLNNLISKQLETAFTNSALNPIQFSYDEKTGKISAKLSIDEETVNVNELGQLYSNGLASSTIEIDTSSIEKRLTELEKTVVQIRPIAGNGINIAIQNGGSVISANIDENSLTFNSDGQLCVNPDALSEYLNGGEGGECANHQHTPEQIQGLAQYVTNIINNSSITNVLKSNLQNLVDETTITINENGQLEAIATHVQKHQHTMSDITDLNQDIANVWATNQRLHADNENQNFNKGAVVMSSLTIGEVLIAFNELLKEQQDSIARVGNRVGTIEPVEPGLINAATFSDMSETIKVIDVKTGNEVEAAKSAVVGTTDIIFYNGSKVHAYIDDKLVETLNAYDTDNTAFATGRWGNFRVTYYGDAYPKFKTFQGYYKGFSFTYTASNLSEGEHIIQFAQENVNTGYVIKSDKITVRIYKDFTPTGRIDIVKWPSYTGFVSGVRCNNEDMAELTFRVVTKAYSNRYTPIVTDIVNVLGKTYELEINQFTDEGVAFKPITIQIDEAYYGKIAISANIYNFARKTTVIAASTGFINIDKSTEEQYRWVQTQGAKTPVDNGIEVFEKYNTSDALLNNLSDEMQVKNHIAIVGSYDYSQDGIGQDYSTKDTEQMITLRFQCPKINNFYFDLYDENNEEFSCNKNGTLKDLQVFASIAPSSTTSRWINCNAPYAGYGSWIDGKIFNGLDLFRTEKARRWITFGKDPISESGYLYLKLISNGAKINLSKLIASVEESLNERK